MFCEGIKLIRKTGRSLILFEIGVQLVTFVVIVPFMGAVADSAIYLAGLRFLTNAGIVQLLKSPWTYPLAALIIMTAAAQLLMHFTGAIVILKSAHDGIRLSFRELIYELASGFKRMFSPGAGTLILHLVMLLPAISVPAAGGLVSAVGIPDILSRAVASPYMLLPAYALAVILCMLISIRWIFALPIYVCRHCSFRSARRQSRSLISGSSFAVLIRLLVWSLGFLAAFALIIVLITGVGIGCLLLFGISVSYGSPKLNIIRLCLVFAVFLFSAGAVPFFCAGVFVQYEKLLSKRISIGKKHRSNAAHKGKKSRISALAAAISAIVLVCVDAAYILRLASGEAAVRFMLNVRPFTVAHRGYSYAAPENTQYAFIAAMEQGADGIELDVQQTKDGVLVVAHDINLKRVAGINRKISSLTYSELSDIDVGSWFSPEFCDARIMSLEDVLKLTDGKIFLNIELKRGAASDHIEQKVVSLIEEYGIENKCCITSFSYDSLKRVKRCNENIKTGLIMSIATGNFYTLEAADAFSIKSTFISAQTVGNAHQQGKEIYAWTVNSSGEMRRMINLNVDHIITDRPALLMEQIDRNISEDTLLDTALSLIS